ncbi:MAG: CNNM domain-containing protein [Anaerovoracaceae bacterium]
MSGILYFVAKIFAPIVWLLTVSTNLILRLLRINPEEEDSTVTEESIKMMLAEGKERASFSLRKTSSYRTYLNLMI